MHSTFPAFPFHRRYDSVSSLFPCVCPLSLIYSLHYELFATEKGKLECVKLKRANVQRFVVPSHVYLDFNLQNFDVSYAFVIIARCSFDCQTAHMTDGCEVGSVCFSLSFFVVLHSSYDCDD